MSQQEPSDTTRTTPDSSDPAPQTAPAEPRPEPHHQDRSGHEFVPAEPPPAHSDVDQAGQESFPASDPPAHSGTT